MICDNFFKEWSKVAAVTSINARIREEGRGDYIWSLSWWVFNKNFFPQATEPIISLTHWSSCWHIVQQVTYSILITVGKSSQTVSPLTSTCATVNKHLMGDRLTSGECTILIVTWVKWKGRKINSHIERWETQQRIEQHEPI